MQEEEKIKLKKKKNYSDLLIIFFSKISFIKKDFLNFQLLIFLEFCVCVSRSPYVLETFDLRQCSFKKNTDKQIIWDFF